MEGERETEREEHPAPEPERAEEPRRNGPAPEAPAPRAQGPSEDEKKYLDQLIRLKAEFENYRKRVDREKPELIRHGKRELLERLIPLYDVLLAAHQQVVQHAELARKAAGQGADPGAELVRGLEMIFAEFTRLFKAEGVEPIAALGKPYDFDKHEVLGQVETDEHPEGAVVEELQRGYTLDGRVLRAAKVRIAKAKQG